jgi:hypothetical protein
VTSWQRRCIAPPGSCRLSRHRPRSACITDAGFPLFNIRYEGRRTVMAVTTASQAGAPTVEVAAGELGGTKLGRHRPLWYTVLGLVIPTAAFFMAWGMHGSNSSTYRIDSQWSALTGLFILALAIERALEPFSRKLGPDTTKLKAERDKKPKVLGSPAADHEKRNAADSQSAVEMSRRLTAVVTWGVATGLAFLLCAQLNITLLQAVRANGSGQPPFWADLLVTGLVVGAGTKPLHDLVSNIERGKDDKEGPAAGRR